MSLDHEEYVERVLQCVETIPRGRVSTYGAIAEVVGALLGGGGPRLVGSTMAQHGGAVTLRNSSVRPGMGIDLHRRRFRSSIARLGGAFAAPRAMGGENAGARRSSGKARRTALCFRSAER